MAIWVEKVFMLTWAILAGVPCCPLKITLQCYADKMKSDVMFSDKFLMSDVLSTNLMLTGLFFLFSPFLSF